VFGDADGIDASLPPGLLKHALMEMATRPTTKSLRRSAGLNVPESMRCDGEFNADYSTRTSLAPPASY
jgi:hypothetical protein